MLNEVLKAHLVKEFRDIIRGGTAAEAKEIRAGEIYSKQRQLRQMQHQVDRMTDELAELRQMDVDVELKKSALPVAE